MFTVEKMYGVIESNPLVKVRPSRALVNDILNLPSGEKIGLHTVLPQEKNAEIIIDGVRFRFQDTGSYWDELIDASQTSNLEVVFLDDFELHIKTNTLILAARRNQENMQQRWLEQLTRREFSREIDDHDRLFKQTIYEANVKARHALIIERRDEMVRRIAESEPRLLVVQQGFADYFTCDPEYLETKGLQIGEYKREEVLANMLRPLETVRANLTKAIPQPGLLSVTMPFKLLERQFAAVTQGRILPEGNPDFIGTWSVDCPPEGLFEVYVTRDKDGQIFGEIYDGIGEARFHGFIDSDHQVGKVEFYKEYLPNQSLESVVKEPMIYLGSFKDGICRGEYFVESLKPKGEFIMNPGSKLLS